MVHKVQRIKQSLQICATLLLAGLANTVAGADAAYDKSQTVQNIQAYAYFKAGNYADAKALWEALAARGNTTAMINLANLFQQGIGVDQDDQHALEFIQQAAERGDVRAQYELGMEYEKGILLPRDISQAAHWLLASAQQDNMDAQYAYGSMLLTAFGRGMQAVSPDQQQQALYWLTKAKSNGHLDAADYLKLFED